MIEPAHLWIPPRVGSYGDEAVDLAAIAGLQLDEEQQLAVDAMLSFGPGGQWAALESAVLEGRQNGKSVRVLLPVTLWDLFMLEPDRIVWTAHLFKTARDAFDAFCVCVDTAPELSRRVKSISHGKGEEAIELLNGATLEFLARSSGGGRGLGGKRVVFDEALILAPTTLGSLIPVLSARPNPHISYGSSAGKVNSDHLHSLKDRGRAGGDPSLIWVEWCAPGSWEQPPCKQGEKCPHLRGVPGCALDDESLWPLANHAMGKRITFEFVRSERRTLPMREFGRERLGWHEALIGSTGVIPAELWSRRLDVDSAAAGRVGVGLDASPDLLSAAVGMTGTRGDGKRHWQVLKYEAGTSWVVPYLQGLKNPAESVFEELRGLEPLEFGPIAIDPGSPAGALIVDLTDAGFEVVEVTGRALVQAWGSFKKDVDDDNGRHIGQAELDQAIRDARNAPSGDVEKFSRKKSSGDICPLVAVTLSDHALRVAPEVEQEFFGAWR